jgi:mono/diheme cytochrome c family protein
MRAAGAPLGLIALLLGVGIDPALLSRSAAGSNAQTSAQAVDYARDVQPLFRQFCYECHGSQRTRGQLRLDRRDVALKGGLSGPVIEAGNSDGSRLVQRLLGLGGEERMPRGRDPLAPDQIALIRAWIDDGAIWPEGEAADKATPTRHWAYVRPIRVPPPAVGNPGWVRNPIDNFVLARLEKEGLAPSPEAPRETLIRRLYLDLVGLPPSVAEVDAFVADTSDDAYDRVVDRLLASAHYGERWARPWLDLARYADSNGYEKDRLRAMWKYRDWVIDALNQDMPFDRFTIEQIAGDMLPGATDGQKIASGFHRNTMLNQEGGIDVEEARWETIIDRVNTTGTVWLGSTIGCAQCHNHKYDPFTQQDYYRLFAFFDNVEYSVAGRPGSDRWIAEPELDLPTPDQDARRRLLTSKIERLNDGIKRADLRRAQDLWERRMLAAERQWLLLDPDTYESTGGSSLTKGDDGSIVVSGARPVRDDYVVTARTTLTGITAVRLEALPDPRLPQGGPGRDYYGNFHLHDVDISIAGPERVRFQRVTLAAAKADDEVSRVDIKSFRGGQAKDEEYGGSAGWMINATRDPERFARQAVFTMAAPVGLERGSVLRIELRHRGQAVGQGIGRFRLSVTSSPDPMRILGIPARLRPILGRAPADRSDDQQKDLAAHYRSIAPSLTLLRSRLEALQKSLRELGVANALVMRERASDERPSTYLRRRGSFLSKGEQVFAGVPAVLHPLPDVPTPNRLALARWLVSDDNPLVARVTVNRAWEQLFGRGIVETSEDFGAQGSPPSHPELLDWMATEFMGNAWSMKKLHRMMVTSATYRQRSDVTSELRAGDPFNRLLARGPRFRMEAEMIRDVVLAASGLLSGKVGGPSVFPTQPDGIWQNPYSEEKWKTSAGEDRYRRGLYTFIRRTSPYPSFLTLDATSRESCTVRRVRTNTPLQALALLNDEAYIEAARALARRVFSEAPPDDRARATLAFRLCVARQPRREEIDRLVASYHAQVQRFAADRNAAATVTAGIDWPAAADMVAERAAWTMVANALLNLDETLTKE